MGAGRRHGQSALDGGPASGVAYLVVGLAAPRASHAAPTGARAANLAHAAGAGLPFMAGFVLTTRRFDRTDPD